MYSNKLGIQFSGCKICCLDSKYQRDFCFVCQNMNICMAKKYIIL